MSEHFKDTTTHQGVIKKPNNNVRERYCNRLYKQLCINIINENELKQLKCAYGKLIKEKVC